MRTQALMNIEAANDFMFPFFHAEVLEQRSPHTRVVRGWLHSRGWAARLCAPREVGTPNQKKRFDRKEDNFSPRAMLKIF